MGRQQQLTVILQPKPYSWQHCVMVWSMLAVELQPHPKHSSGLQNNAGLILQHARQQLLIVLWEVCHQSSHLLSCSTRTRHVSDHMHLLTSTNAPSSLLQGTLHAGPWRTQAAAQNHRSISSYQLEGARDSKDC